MENIKAVLFDLDDTLLNREKTFSLFCDYLIDRLFPPGLSAGEKQSAKEFIILHDKDGYESRAVLYQKIIARYQLACAVDDLEQEWFDNFDRFSEPEDGMIEVLESFSKRYKLGMVTNGSSSMQNRKIDALGIRDYFGAILISGEVGVNKPDSAIFRMACEKLGAMPCDAVFIGDNYVNDVIGARNAGLHAVWMNKQSGGVDYSLNIKRIARLTELFEIIK